LEDLGLDGMMMMMMMLVGVVELKEVGWEGAWIGFIWLRIRTSIRVL
jgi:hypothetical protein